MTGLHLQMEKIEIKDSQFQSCPVFLNLYDYYNESCNSQNIYRELSMHPNPIHYNRYINFIYSRKFRKIPENIYIENHHIIPKSLGGNNEISNLIKLTGREHYIAHLILWKAFKGKMAQAFHYMNTNNKHMNILSNRQFINLKKSIVCSEETIEKIRQSNLGQKRSKETKKKLSEQHKGRKVSEETKRKISKTLRGKTYEELYGLKKALELKKVRAIAKKGNTYKLGKPCSEETKKKIGEGNKGKIMSDKSKKKMSESHKGKKLSKEIKRKMSDSQKKRRNLEKKQ